MKKMKVIGVGVGRTGTHSLKLAINELGMGPCHHMEEVARNLAVQVPLWNTALKGKPDWNAIYDGYESAVDWPTAGFCRELLAEYPDAKFILTVRSPETWAESFSETIHKVSAEGSHLPPQLQPWVKMATDVISKTGFPSDLDTAGLQKAFTAHNEAVQALIPPDRLLVYQVKEGWAPLCAYLGAPVPTIPFPRTNNRTEFWDLIEAAKS
jgi:hypothetical protein